MPAGRWSYAASRPSSPLWSQESSTPTSKCRRTKAPPPPMKVVSGSLRRWLPVSGRLNHRTQSAASRNQPEVAQLLRRKRSQCLRSSVQPAPRVARTGGRFSSGRPICSRPPRWREQPAPAPRQSCQPTAIACAPYRSAKARFRRKANPSCLSAHLSSRTPRRGDPGRRSLHSSPPGNRLCDYPGDALAPSARLPDRRAVFRERRSTASPSRIIAGAISGMTSHSLHPHIRPLRHAALRRATSP